MPSQSAEINKADVPHASFFRCYASNLWCNSNANIPHKKLEIFPWVMKKKLIFCCSKLHQSQFECSCEGTMTISGLRSPQNTANRVARSNKLAINYLTENSEMCSTKLLWNVPTTPLRGCTDSGAVPEIIGQSISEAKHSPALVCCVHIVIRHSTTLTGKYGEMPQRKWNT